MASIEVSLDSAKKRMEVRGGRRVLVVTDGTNEVVFMPRAGEEWLSVWGLGVAVDRLSGDFATAEHGDVHRGLPPLRAVADELERARRVE